AIFIDGTKIEANANKFTFVWRKSTERYHSNLVEKSNQMYVELHEKEIIPEIERENEEELSVEEMGEVVEKLDEKIEEYNKEIETYEDGNERMQLHSELKSPRLAPTRSTDFITRKQKDQKDMEIIMDRNTY